jgi:hypothetical protein
VKTDDVIDNLTQDLAPVSRHALPMRLALGVGIGATASVIAMVLWLGIRSDLMQAAATRAYWMKFFYTALLAIFAFWATGRLARPGSRADWAFAGIGGVFLILLGMAAMRLMRAPPGARMPLIMGHSAHICPWRIVILSLPIFFGAFWSLRALAPTRLILAGAVAGLASGALGAWIYAFHCDESAAPFVLTFYTLGIACLGAAGAAIARPLLRW